MCIPRMLAARAGGTDVTMGTAPEALLPSMNGNDGGVCSGDALLMALVELFSEFVFYGICNVLELILHLLGIFLIELFSVVGAIALGVVAERIGTCVDGRLGDNAIEGSGGMKVLSCSIWFGSEGVDDLILIGDEMA